MLHARGARPVAASTVYHFTRPSDMMHRMDKIILALIFVAASDFGDRRSVLTLTVHGAGMLGSFFAEAIEDVDKRQLEA